jgi:hypothetical protein
LIPGVVVLASIAALGLTYTRPNLGLSSIGRWLAPARGTDEPVIFYGDQTNFWRTQWMVLAATHYSDGAFPRPTAILDRPADPSLLRELRERGGTAWLVWSSASARLEQVLPGCEVLWSKDEPFVATVMHIRWTEPAPPPLTQPTQ